MGRYTEQEEKKYSLSKRESQGGLQGEACGRTPET